MSLYNLDWLMANRLANDVVGVIGECRRLREELASAGDVIASLYAQGDAAISRAEAAEAKAASTLKAFERQFVFAVTDENHQPTGWWMCGDCLGKGIEGDGIRHDRTCVLYGHHHIATPDLSRNAPALDSTQGETK